jgi:hypothetical protein
MWMGMTMADHRAVLSATHVTLETVTTERISMLGATNVVRASDRLVIGPCRRDALEHAQARQAWWNSSEEWDRLYSSEVRWETPVVVWVSASIVDRVNFWRICSGLRQLGIATRDVLILEFPALPLPKFPEEPFPSFDCISSVSDHSDEVLLKRLAQARPFSLARYNRAVSLWNKYTDENPSAFVRSCRSGVKGFPELAPLWAFLSCLFPRRTAEGTLRLNRLDEVLLSILSGEWQTPLAVYAHKSQAGVELRQLFSCMGDGFLPDRLEQWAAHGSSAAVERAAGPRPPDYPMMCSVYRLTERGIQLRDAGLTALTDAPPLPIGGTEAYSSVSPWVLREDGRLVRL